MDLAITVRFGATGGRAALTFGHGGVHLGDDLVQRAELLFELAEFVLEVEEDAMVEPAMVR
ncbi:hypothetical protein BTJ68_00439 [Hortaea werneckii EXF-2000]|uniref:Uncharacterized protein n=1 Tax=Hortaea werneckii EXF-2000 TaxID=1157616 RepID=A0A1Z5TUH0_HORWE|nr:hypothetical protein BTJ68_00439 [Hortaea werneckii EXF-2000]